MIEAISRAVPFEYHAETVQRTVPFEYCTKTVRRTVPFECHAHQLRKVIQDHQHGTEHGTIGYFFQDHHTLHSYDWKNDNKTGQSSTSTSRYSMKGTTVTLYACPPTCSSGL